MPQIQITFQKCVQDSQELGDDQHMVSRVFFDLSVDGKNVGTFHADLKQTVGADFETGPIEVSRPYDYRGPFNQHEFAKEAQAYYRSFVGSQGMAIRGPSGASIRMRNNTFNKTYTLTFSAEGGSGEW